MRSLLEGKLEGKVIWNKLEDMALKHRPEEEEYKFLLETKGEEEIAVRKRFLEIE